MIYPGGDECLIKIPLQLQWWNLQLLRPHEPSKVEGLKQWFLREPVATELLQDTNHFTEAQFKFWSFSHQQDNRDNQTGAEKDYQFILRILVVCAASAISNFEQLAGVWPDVAATTRQGFQMHGILKKNSKRDRSDPEKGSTLAAAMLAAVSLPQRRLRSAWPIYWGYAQNNWRWLLTPQTGAYYELWLDGKGN